MSDFINTVDVLGDEVLTNSIINKSITEYKDNNIKTVGDYTFYKCETLISVDFPNVTSIGRHVFNMCSALISVNFPNVTSIGDYGFAACTTLTSVNIPNVTSIGSQAFDTCMALTGLDLHNVTSVGAKALYYCSVLTTLILRSETMCTLSSTDALTSTPIASGTGYIYVPSSLVSTYQADTNWSTYSAQFRALEDYTVDGTITGDLDSTKI